MTSALIRFVGRNFGVDVSRLGGIDYDPHTMTFGWWDGDDLVANISLFPRLLCLSGVETAALGIQSVATMRAYRGRGLFTDLIRKALAYADDRDCPVVFTTDKPDLYLRWGFRPVSENAFAVQAAPATTAPRCRRLALDRDDDIALIKALFSTRAATSAIASTRDHISAFLIKAILVPGIEVMHLPDLAAIVAVQARDGPSMVVLDVIAATIPTVQDIVCALGYRGARVILHLTPDLLCSTRDPVPSPYYTPLMVRGDFAPEGAPFMLSRMRI